MEGIFQLDSPWIALAIGLVAAGVGGSLFERGLVSLAGGLRVPGAVIGMTVAAFATSSPELTVGISASLAGESELALGDALGSNLVNFGLVLGLASAIWTVKLTQDVSPADFRLAIFAPTMPLLLGADGSISRWDGVALLVGFSLWLLFTIRRTISIRLPRDASHEKSSLLAAIVATVVGCAVLVLAGRMISGAGIELGTQIGLDTFVVGATLIALGTSVPELAVTLVSQVRGRGELGFGTLLGSNLFNGLFIIGVAAVIHPMQVSFSEVVVTIAFGILTVLIAWPVGRKRVSRRQGALLIASYALYVTMLAG